MITHKGFSSLPRSAQEIVKTVFGHNQRVLLWGESGAGKSTLAEDLARELGDSGRGCRCVSADPGSPAFGVPGAVCLGEWREGDWRMLGLEALCSLDAARFRLPLVSALQRLAEREISVPLLIDAPGVTRGVAGAELLLGIAAAARVDAVLVLAREGNAVPLPSELRSLAGAVFVIPCAAQARRPPKKERARRRTALWDGFLGQAQEYAIGAEDIQFIGTPPPEATRDAWRGRQIALLDARSHTLALGEVLGREGDALNLRIPRLPEPGRILLVRDARREADGMLATARPPVPAPVRYTLPPDMAPWSGAEQFGVIRPLAQVGPATAVLINGVFGDPLLHLRLRHQRRSLLFDLGEAARLPGRIAHQVSDLFITHAHIDHIGGFLWLLRSRIGDLPACRLFGPPGLAENVAGLVRGIHWDRIGDRGPRFEVAELHDCRLERFSIQAGRVGAQPLGGRQVTNGVLLDEPEFLVRAITLDHGTPVLAFAFESRRQFAIRKDRLTALGLAAGPWLMRLKRSLAADDQAAPIELPDGRVETAGALAREMVRVKPAQKLVYATDLADTPANRRRLAALAQGAHTLFCEAAFAEVHARQAANTGHLTARACGEIASDAAVDHLVPFHLSRRYEKDPGQVYREVLAACPWAMVPEWVQTG